MSLKARLVLFFELNSDNFFPSSYFLVKKLEKLFSKEIFLQVASSIQSIAVLEMFLLPLFLAECTGGEKF